MNRDNQSKAAHEPSRTVSIDEQAIATITVPGYVDFLAADGQSIWATNRDRVEKFQFDRSSPVETLSIPGPCGAMVVAFESLWVASCKAQSVFRIDLQSGHVSAKISTGLADP